MDVGTTLALAGLALVDSTSIGTLVIPLALMLNPKMRLARFFTYLGTVAGCYFVFGAVLVAAAGAVRRGLAGIGESAPVTWAQLVVGVALFALSFRYDAKRVARRRLRRGRPDPVTRWRERAGTDGASAASMVMLGLAATALEVMTMLPYLAAVGIISTAGVGARLWLPLLLGYVLVMVLPALVLLVLRTVARRWAEPVLERLNAWISRHSAGALGWLLGIVGVLLAADAYQRLQPFG